MINFAVFNKLYQHFKLTKDNTVVDQTPGTKQAEAVNAITIQTTKMSQDKNNQLIFDTQTQTKKEKTQNEHKKAQAEQDANMTQPACKHSYRITAPLRWFNKQLKLLKQHGLIARTKAFIKKIARPIALRVITFINSRSGLRRQFVQLSRRLGIYNLARTVYLRSSRLTYQTPSTLNKPIITEIARNKAASPYEQRIFADLKVAIAKNHKMSI